MSSKNFFVVRGIGAVEERGVGRHAEAALHRRFDRADGHIVHAFFAYREIVFLLRPVHMNGEREVSARRELGEHFFEQNGVCAEVNILFALNEAVDDLDDLRVHQWFATGMLTMGAPHSSTALKHCSGVRFLRRICPGY